MIKLMDKMQIIQKHLGGTSNRQIAKEIGLNRKTVDKYVSEYVKLILKLNSNSISKSFAVDTLIIPF